MAASGKLPGSPVFGRRSTTEAETGVSRRAPRSAQGRVERYTWTILEGSGPEGLKRAGLCGCCPGSKIIGKEIYAILKIDFIKVEKYLDLWMVVDIEYLGSCREVHDERSLSLVVLSCPVNLLSL